MRNVKNKGTSQLALEHLWKNFKTSGFEPLALLTSKKRRLLIARHFTFDWTNKIFPPLIVYHAGNDNGAGK